MKARLAPFLAASALCVAASAQSSGPQADTSLPQLQHIDVTQVDPSVNPCVNFHQYVCNKDFAANPIPPDHVGRDGIGGEVLIADVLMEVDAGIDGGVDLSDVDVLQLRQRGVGLGTGRLRRSGDAEGGGREERGEACFHEDLSGKNQNVARIAGCRSSEDDTRWRGGAAEEIDKRGLP